MSVETLAQALLEAGILDAPSVEMRVPRARSGTQLLDGIVSDGIATESSLVNQLARALSVPRYDPKERSPEPEALSTLDARSVEELGVLPVALRGAGALLWVAMCDPTDAQLLGEVARRTGRRVKACVIGPRELARALGQLGQAPQPQQAPLPNAQAYQANGYRVPMPAPAAAPMPNPAAAYAPFGYPAQPPPQQGFVPGVSQAPTPAARGGDVQRLESELAQAKQVVKVLVQMLVERGLLDGEELKQRLRAERDRKG